MKLKMKELLIMIAKGLVEDPDAVEVVEDEPDEDGVIVFHLHVAPDDMGRVIGKQGRIAKAMRTVMRAAAVRQNAKVAVEIDCTPRLGPPYGTLYHRRTKTNLSRGFVFVLLLKRKYPRFCREKKGFSNRFPQRGNALERSYMSKSLIWEQMN